MNLHLPIGPRRDDQPHDVVSTTTFDVDSFVKNSNRRTFIYFIGLVLGMVAVGVLSNSARLYGQDQNNATKIQFAQNDRSACLSDLRSTQFNAIGSIAVHNARSLAALSVILNAPVPEADQFDYAAEVQASLDAADDLAVVTEQLKSENLNKPVSEGGCGPVISSLDDLTDEQKAEGDQSA